MPGYVFLLYGMYQCTTIFDAPYWRCIQKIILFLAMACLGSFGTPSHWSTLDCILWSHQPLLGQPTSTLRMERNSHWQCHLCIFGLIIILVYSFEVLSLFQKRLWIWPFRFRNIYRWSAHATSLAKWAHTTPLATKSSSPGWSRLPIGTIPPVLPPSWKF